jgi:alginate biosynthesis protein AlgK
MRPSGAVRYFVALLLAASSAVAGTPVPLKQGTGLIISGAAGLPDLARGEQAAAEGRHEDAERDLLPLAERGYLAAQFGLAKLYSGWERPDAADKAIRWYRVVLPKMPTVQVPLARLLLRDMPSPSARNAAEQLMRKAWTQREEIEALAGLLKLYREYPDQDRGHHFAADVAKAERLDRAETNLALLSWYRATPRIEGHPERLLALCRKTLNLAPECYVDLATAARNHGDRPTVRRLGGTLLSQLRAGVVPATVAASFARSVISDSNPDLIDEAPLVLADLPEDNTPPDTNAAPPATQGSCPEAPINWTLTPPAANALPATTTARASASAPLIPEPELADAIVHRLLDGPLPMQVLAAGIIVRFPSLAPEVPLEPLLLAGRKQGVDDAALYLGQLYIGGQRALRQPAMAREAFEAAAQQPMTAVTGEYYLGRLYQSGYLDEVDPRQARDHLLRAARAGYISADAALAHLYSSGKGVCPNRRYAYVFARLGAQDGTAPALALLENLRKTLTADELRAGDALLREELAARAATGVAS